MSLFGGIETGLQALQELGIPIEEYHSFEILPAAIKVTKKNFPFVIHHGDVREADFTQFKDFDLILAGSPCQNRSRARKEDRNVHSGLKGDKSSLFWCFAKALEVVKPKWFLLENVVSEIPEDDKTITDTVGVEPVMIDSNLFSAQDRERLYWTNIPIASLPTSCDTVLKDILDDNVDEKYFYNKPFTYNGDDKKIQATLEMKGHDIIKRVNNKNYKSPTLTSCRGGNLQKKVYDNGRCRKLTPNEYRKLQTIPDWYKMNVANSHIYNMCGDGWTIEVIKHIFKGLTEKE